MSVHPAKAMLTVIHLSHRKTENHAVAAGGCEQEMATHHVSVSAQQATASEDVSHNSKSCAHYTLKFVQQMRIAGEHHLQIHTTFLTPKNGAPNVHMFVHLGDALTQAL